MSTILFDASSHLGQFCTTDENVRKGCKNMQASLMKGAAGMWTDLENGRTDRTIWNLPADVQDLYYPVMDRYFSAARVRQEPLSEREEDMSVSLHGMLPGLSVYSRQTCATAIAHGVTEVHTLVEELLGAEVQELLQSRHGVRMVLPYASEESAYADEMLESRYQSALKAFRLLNVNLPSVLADGRKLRL